jgi:hypothetical protein
MLMAERNSRDFACSLRAVAIALTPHCFASAFAPNRVTMIALRKVMPVAAVLNGATPARCKATAAVRMSPPPISTGFHSLGVTLSASILGSSTSQPDLSQMGGRCQPRVVRSLPAMAASCTKPRSGLARRYTLSSPTRLASKTSAYCARPVPSSQSADLAHAESSSSSAFASLSTGVSKPSVNQP